jgi:hypothetical protein
MPHDASGSKSASPSSRCGICHSACSKQQRHPCAPCSLICMPACSSNLAQEPQLRQVELGTCSIDSTCWPPCCIGSVCLRYMPINETSKNSQRTAMHSRPADADPWHSETQYFLNRMARLFHRLTGCKPKDPGSSHWLGETIRNSCIRCINGQQAFRTDTRGSVCLYPAPLCSYHTGML